MRKPGCGGERSRLSRSSDETPALRTSHESAQPNPHEAHAPRPANRNPAFRPTHSELHSFSHQFYRMIGSRVSQNAPGGIMIPTPAQAYVQQRRHHHRCRAPGLGAPRPLRAHHRGRAPLPQRPAWRRRICQRVGWLRGPICNVPALSKQPTPPVFQLLVTKGYLPLLIMTSDLDVPPSRRILEAVICYKTSDSPYRLLVSSQPTPARRIALSATHGKSTFVTTIAI